VLSAPEDLPIAWLANRSRTSPSSGGGGRRGAAVLLATLERLATVQRAHGARGGMSAHAVAQT
jgi:hypothetical protein